MPNLQVTGRLSYREFFSLDAFIVIINFVQK